MLDVRHIWLPTLQLSTMITVMITVPALSGCTEIKENFPDGGCAADALRCIDNNLYKCNEGQTAFSIVKECESDSPCGGSPLDCSGKSIVGGSGGPTCATNEDCEDQLGTVGACYQPFCESGSCRVQPMADGNSCDDENACTKSDQCTEGVCSGTPQDCDDGDPCTADFCDPVDECTHAPSTNNACDDNKPCTKNDACTEGACEGTLLNCDDGNPCTDDSCDLATGECAQTIKQVGTLCDDGNECTEGETCTAGICEGGEFICSCQTIQDCIDKAPVDPCKGQWQCIEELCTPDASTAVVCIQDGLGPCHHNTCGNVNGEGECEVIAKATGTPCTDGNACTTGDVCTDGECIGESDSGIAGCGSYVVGWYTISSEFIEWKSVDTIPGLGVVTIRATVGYPQVFGEAQNNEYRVRAIAPGL